MEKQPKINSFKLQGIGILNISEGASFLTGKSVGFSFEIVSEDQKRLVSGLISRRDAKKLAEHILNNLQNCKYSEEEILNREGILK